MTQILLIDDHEVIRSGLKMYIKNILENIEIDEAGNGDMAFEKIKQKEYQLIMLDVNMPSTDSLGLMGNILAIRPSANILIFSMNSEEVYAKRYLQLGAKGYLSKHAPQAEIAEAITTVLSSKRYISTALKMQLAEDVIEKKNENPFNNLSPREFEIVQHLIKGESSAKICSDLNLHSSTIATYKSRIFEKLQSRNIVDIIALAKLHHIAIFY